METVKRAVITAAGEGKRLRPVTENIPKPLVTVNGIRIIDTSIQALKTNGIHEIYIVVGYKKELFHQAYDKDPEIHIIENPDYLNGNNITSLYAARDYLEQAFVIEADIFVRNPAVFDPIIKRSMYCCRWMPMVPEWAVKLNDDQLELCDIDGNVANAYRLWGISMWTAADGQRLSEEVKEQVEDKKDVSLFWDQIPLTICKDKFSLGIRTISEGDLIEIDTVRELAALDPHYNEYC